MFFFTEFDKFCDFLRISCIFEGFSDQNYFPKIVSKCLPERYVFENGGRDYLLNKFGLSSNDIIAASKKII